MMITTSMCFVQSSKVGDGHQQVSDHYYSDDMENDYTEDEMMTMVMTTSMCFVCSAVIKSGRGPSRGLRSVTLGARLSSAAHTLT